jgi:hypothetical protein
MGFFTSQELVDFAKRSMGTFTTHGASTPVDVRRSRSMIGKLFGAWLGDKIAGPGRGTKGAIIGYGAAALARRSVPALAAVALGGWAFRKLRNRRRRGAPAYPSEAAPASPSSDGAAVS